MDLLTTTYPPPPSMINPNTSIFEILWLVSALLGLAITIDNRRKTIGVIAGKSKFIARFIMELLLVVGGIVVCIAPNPINPTIATYFVPIMCSCIALGAAFLVVTDHQIYSADLEKKKDLYEKLPPL